MCSAVQIPRAQPFRSHVLSRIRLLLRGMIPNARPDDYRSCRREVMALVSRINQRFPLAVNFQETQERKYCVVSSVQ